MRRGLDTNVLVYAHIAQLPGYEARATLPVITFARS
jgi:hypothetical protein